MEAVNRTSGAINMGVVVLRRYTAILTSVHDVISYRLETCEGSGMDPVKTFEDRAKLS